MSAAFANTLFTQTANFAADDFGIGDRGQGVGGAVVRLGIVLALPFAVLADRLGRRRIDRPHSPGWHRCSRRSGALAPNFWVLVASQTVGPPAGHRARPAGRAWPPPRTCRATAAPTR